MRVRIELRSRVFAGAARQVAEVVGARPRAVLGLAAGRTMEPLYAALAARLREEGTSLREAQGFLLDDYLGLGPEDPRSLRAAVAGALLGPTDLPAASLHGPDGLAADPEAEAARYEAAIRAAGGIDLQLLGLGGNGHLGFNEPGAALLGRAHVAWLAEETLEANRAALTAGGAPPPQAAITLGLGTLLGARRCVLVATGAAKAAAVAAAVEGPLTARVPASVLQLHPDATLWLDEEAASGLRHPEPWRRAARLARAAAGDEGA